MIETTDPDKQNMKPKEPNPAKNANLLSLLLFVYVLPILIKGNKKDLEEDDMVEHLEEHTSKILGDKLEEAWKKELVHQCPSLWRALRRIFGFEFFIIGLIYLCNEMIIKTAQPLALFQVMKYYTRKNSGVSKNEARWYAGLIVATSFVSVLIGHNHMLRVQYFGMKLRVACCSLIYRKCLKLDKSALEKITVGQIINLLSNDVNMYDRATHTHMLWVCPIHIIVVGIFLTSFFGLTSTVGILFIVLFVPFQIYLGKMNSKFRVKTANKTDERIRIMNEIISGIQIIKMYTWEKSFALLVAKFRKLEIKHIRVRSYIKSVMTSFTVFIPRFSIFLTILTYVLTGNNPQAEYVFVVTSFYNILKQIVTKHFAIGIMELAEVNVSVSRLRNFLLQKEVGNQFRLKTSTVDRKGVYLENVFAKWPSSPADHTLYDINLKIESKTLIAIIGSVGSGKSSLLSVILKELPVTKGKLSVQGTIAYASQESWLFNGDVRENILFGEKMDLERYRKVLEVCALEEDLLQLPHADRTIIGERGTMLSGGQRARINLARAVYKDVDIYLLDDPLSAVDPNVGNKLFESCILKFLKNKCVILVTHQLQYLNYVDFVYVIKNGLIVGKGTYRELMASCADITVETKQEKDELSEKIQEELHNTEEKGYVEVPVQVKEHRSYGTISAYVYVAYLRAGGSLFTIICIILVMVLTQVSASGCDYFLTFWVNVEQSLSDLGSYYSSLTRNDCIYIYSIILCFMIVLTLVGTFSFYKYCMSASIGLHDKMFSNIVHAPMIFFNTNSSGRILNRFSKDIGSVDEVLPSVVIDCIEIGLNVMGVIVLVTFVKPWLLVVSIVILILFYNLRLFYLKTSRSVKRLEGITRSPVFGHTNASLEGLTTIRAFRAQDLLQNEFDDLQDNHSSTWFLFLICARAFGFWIDLICVVYIAIVTFSFFISDNEVYGGNIGLTITQAISLTGRLQWGVRQWSELENQMTSVERIVEYTQLCREKCSKEINISENWPENGSIQFVSVSMRYSTSRPYVLNQLSFRIEPKEKIGIIGRTGSGKSSLVNALFQLTEIEGNILIDDVDIQKVSFQRLRSKISIIPQEPVLFSGSLRKNLDPFDEHTDEMLWNALEEVELKSIVAEFPSGLHVELAGGGSNFSVGQRQLICLARAIVRNNKILVMDEATANVDQETDSLIQNTIRRRFVDCTVLTVAHRLHTIMDSDKVLVMEFGKLMEFNHPFLLIKDENGLFRSMVNSTGHPLCETLTKIAADSYTAKYTK